jgi:drug/metabolite transporter (DMT)-like permease
MSWQFLLIVYLVLTTVAGLLQRRLGQAIPQHNRLVNGFFFVCIHYPIGLVTASIIGFHLDIGWTNAIILAGGGIAFPISGILAYRASKDVDASLFGILQNFQPVITIILAVLLLSQHLNVQQLIGALIIIGSALTVSSVSYSHGSKSTRTGLMIALLAIALMGLETVYESWMLGRLDFGTYIVFGLGSQTFWMAVFAWPQRRNIRKIINRKYGPTVLVSSLSKSLKGLAFVGALYLSKSASLVSAFISFLPVMMVVAGYLFLHEKQYLKLKISAAIVGSAGLIILSLSK